MTSNMTSLCRDLFQADANTVFTNLKCQKKEQFIEEALSIVLKVHRVLLSNQGAFPLVDPMAFNNQCHLYALKVCEIQRKYAHMSDEEKEACTPENRFLHLAIFLNYALMTDTNTYIKVVEKTMGRLGLRHRSPKLFKRFLRDEGHRRETYARNALNRDFKEDILKRLQSAMGNPIYAEMERLAKEELVIDSSRGADFGKFYTFPKLAGVAYFVDEIARNNIPFVVKVKVLTRDGAAGVLVQSSRGIADDEAAIVFEAFATDGTMTVPDCRTNAKSCPIYFHRYVEKNRRHDKGEPCFYCRAVQIDLSGYRHRLDQAMQRRDEMFYALGADFIDKIQTNFRGYFEDDEIYPYLSKLYRAAIPLIDELGLDMNNPRTFSICHTYSDVGRLATSTQFQLDLKRKAFLDKRGVL